MLGSVLAVCLSLVVFVEDLGGAPGTFFFKLLVLSSIFSLFGIIVNRIKKHLGYCPVFIAALWLPLEYCLIRYTGAGILLDLRVADSGWLARISSLFGLLTISFFIVLVNSVSVLIIDYVGRKLLSTMKSSSTCRIRNFSLFENIKSTKRWNCLPDLRAPPIL